MFEGPLVPPPTLAERAEAAQEARRYVARHLATVRIKGALNHQTPLATKRNYQPGDKVLIWCEKQVENRIGQGIGPCIVVSINEVSRIVLVQLDPDSPYERYHITQVKHFIEGGKSETNFLSVVHHALSQFSSTGRMMDLINNRQVDNAATRLVVVPDKNSTSSEQLSQSIHMRKEVAFDTYATEIIQASDPRA